MLLVRHNRSMGDYTSALFNAQNSLEIFQRSRRADHLDLALVNKYPWRNLSFYGLVSNCY